MAAKTRGAAGGMTKAEAVRQAITELGRDAKPIELQEHIQSKYGIRMTTGHVKVERQKYLKKESLQATTVAGASANETPAETATPGPRKTTRRKGKRKGMTKQEAVRRTLDDLGRDAKPTQMKAHIKEHYGMDMTADHVSTSKGIILKKEAARASRPAAVPSAARTVEPAPRPPEKPTSRAGDGGLSIGFEDIEKVRDLLDRVGETGLRRLIDVMAR